MTTLTPPPFECQTSDRRQRIRAFNEACRRTGQILNGIDFVEVDKSFVENTKSPDETKESNDQVEKSCVESEKKASAEQVTVSVHLFCKLPTDPTSNHVQEFFQIADDAGQEVPFAVCSTSSRERIKLVINDANHVRLVTSRPHTVRFRPSEVGRSAKNYFGVFDPSFSSERFIYFDPMVQLEIDPESEQPCTDTIPWNVPEIDYTARDFQSYKRLLTDRLSLTMPEWRESHVPDVGVAVTEVMAYAADHLSQFQDAVATEAYLSTARQRISARRHARLIDYEVDEGSNARTLLQLEVASDVWITPQDMYFITRPSEKALFDPINLMEAQLDGLQRSQYQTFEAVFDEQEEKPALDPPDLSDPLTLLIQVRFVPIRPESPIYRIVRLLRAQLERALQSLVDFGNGIVAAYRAIHAMTTIGDTATLTIVGILNDVIHHANLRSHIDVERLSEWAQEQIAQRNPKHEWETINRIILSDLFPEQIARQRLSRPQKVQMYHAHNRIEFYTWNQGECCLPKGATQATLRDSYVNGDSKRAKRVLHLQAGDLLLLEEVMDPKTGVAKDADRTHRQFVRLTNVDTGLDPLTKTPLVHIAWHKEDALRFSLCISSHKNQPPCIELPNVAIARGNILAVDHGVTIYDEHVGRVTAQQKTPSCYQDDLINPHRAPINRFQPKLENPGLAFSLTPRFGDSVASWLEPPPTGTRSKDEIQSKPSIQVLGIPEDPETGKPILEPANLSESEQCAACVTRLDGRAISRLQNAVSPELGQTLIAAAQQAPERSSETARRWGRYLCYRLSQDLAWHPQVDLMESSDTDQHFVAEVDNYNLANLRFGQGLGKQPLPGTHFYATYRVGGGRSGNVGADSINRVVFRRGFHSTITKVRNPISAVGGREAETLDHIKLHAPHANREIDRAITAEDYVEIVRREFAGRVNGVRCEMHRCGALQTVQITVDPSAGVDAAELIEKVANRLELFRRAGHRVQVCKPIPVGLTIQFVVRALPGHVQSNIRKEFATRFGQGTLPGGELAFFHPDRLSFDAAILPSELTAEAMKIDGVLSATVSSITRAHRTQSPTLKDDENPSQQGDPSKQAPSNATQLNTSVPPGFPGSPNAANPTGDSAHARDLVPSSSAVESTGTAETSDAPVRFRGREIPQVLNDHSRPESGIIHIDFEET